MNYKKDIIKEGINLHTIKTNKFKTNLVAVFLTLPLKRENVTKEALVSAVLRRGSKNYTTSEEISIALEEMYGASFDCGIEKMGDTHILKFYIEALNEDFLPQKEEILKTSINMLFDIVFNPLTQNCAFTEKYVEMEKENLKQIIESKKDNKARYALERCVEEMYKNIPFGLYKYGYIEDLNDINEKDLYEVYTNIIKTAKIDIFVSGKVESEEIKNIISKNEQINKLAERTTNFIKNEPPKEVTKPKEITEKMDITQGKLIYGLSVKTNNVQQQYSAIVYNAILGGGANSKLFQNVREKASLAYTAGSNYVRQKDNIFIRLRN
jgi:predicted Zn-dependent peptidase